MSPKSSSATPAKPAHRGPAGDLVEALSGSRGFVLAVSGGPDSTALMVLVAGWAERPPVIVVSVDHRLRPEAAGEAGQVAGQAAQLGLACRIMHCEGLLPGGNIQARARDARYSCLAQAAREAGFDTIVTAHHQDDQAETFLLRLARGSGVYGLGAMRGEMILDGLSLVRPLLGRSRAELAAIAAAAGMPVVADPSNGDARFDRVRMRKIMPILAGHGLDAARLAATARGLARAADALDALAGELIATHFRVDRFGVVRGDPQSLATAHREIGLRALSRLVAAASGAVHGPDLDRVVALLGVIAASGANGSWRRTLHGAVVTCRAGELALRREWGRAGLADLPAAAGESVVWDRRFRIAVPHWSGGLSVRPLGRVETTLRLLPADRVALRTLPGLYAGDRLVALPSGVSLSGQSGAAPARLDAVCVVQERLGRGSRAPEAQLR